MQRFSWMLFVWPILDGNGKRGVYWDKRMGAGDSMPERAGQTDIAVVGGGAAGLTAALLCARAGARTVLLEKAPRVGKKLLATGNGTCNLSNLSASPARYHGAGSAGFVRPVLEAYPPRRIMAFFEELGLACEARADGRIYPRTAQASAVLDCLRLAMSAAGAEERTGCSVTAMQRTADGFVLETDGGRLTSRLVLVSTGGAAAPSLGGGTDGYTLLTALGHTRTPLFPSIVQVKTDPSAVRALKGIRLNAAVTFRLDGRTLSQETGELLFTEYGLSGPAVMQASRPVGDWERRKAGRMTAVLDLLPDRTERDLCICLEQRRRLPGRTLEDYFTGLLHKRVGQALLRQAGIGPFTRPVSDLSEKQTVRLANGIKNWEIPVIGTQGMGGAQVTAGGIALDEVDPASLMSRKVPGLYLAGEVLDVDGDCGGFNLQWAWASAHAAASAMRKALKRQKEVKR